MNAYAKALVGVQETSPLVQCITNFVTVNDCANIVLAVGARPSMAQDIREVEEAVSFAGALVCNLGDMEHIESMVLAGKRANELGVPVILDPVAVGGTQLRRDFAACLLSEVHFSAIRGNASEIFYLAGKETTGSGVDVSLSDCVGEDNYLQALELVADFAQKSGSVIALSGELDLISDGSRSVVLRNGCANMARVTGTGCMLTSLIGAFCAGYPEDYFDATVAAMAAMGIAGERAEAKRQKEQSGNASLRNYLIDEVFTMTAKRLQEGMRYEIYPR